MSKNDKAYGAIASLYEYLMEVDYDGWAEYILSAVKQYTGGRVALDIGCGSGAFTRRFKRSGLDVTGIDVSQEMLGEAVRISREEGLNITYLQQDARTFRPQRRVDVITAVTDLVNYLSPIEAERFFARAYASLKTGGVLFFDVSSEHKIKNILADNMFGEDGEDFSYLWFNTPFEGGVEMDITVYTKAENGLYRRKDEHHVQYAHSKEGLIASLERVGFTVARVEGHLGQPLADDAERINLIAVKQK